MASGNSGYFDLSGNYGATLRVHWAETYEVETNQSVVTITALQVMSSWYYGVTYYLDGSISVNNSVAVNMSVGGGTNPVTVSALNAFYNVGGTLGAVSGITHNDDGTKTTTISVSVSGYTSSGNLGSGWYVSGTHTITLATIPRKSTLSAGNGTLGTAQILTVDKKADSFSHNITYTCGGIEVPICTHSKETSISWTPPIGLASNNKTGTSVSIKLTIATYSGTEHTATYIGSDSVTITCAIPASVAPSCSLSVSDYTGLASTYGAMVKGYSKLSVAVTAQTSYGAGITLYQISADGSVYNAASVVTDVLKSSGNLAVSASVIDQRGRGASASQNISVLDYSAPAVTLLKVKRCNQDGTDNDQGEYCQVTFSGKVTSLGNKNRASYKLEYRRSGDSAYTAVTFDDLANNYAVTEAKHIFVADSGSSYEVKVTIADNFTSDSSTVPLSTGATIMHWKANGKGMGIGKVSEIDNTLDMGWNIQMNGKSVTGLPTPVNSSDAVPKNYIDGKFAPAGYGLGDYSVTANWSDINNILKNGWYRFTSGVAVDGYTFNQAFMEVSAWNNGLLIQKLYPNYPWHLELRRFCYGSTFTPWEWYNPPFISGVEYRTTERWEGKAVYTKVVNLGTLPNASAKRVAIGISGIADKFVTVRTIAQDSTGNVFDIDYGGANASSFIEGKAQLCVNIPYADFSGYTGYAFLEYTKL